MGRRRSPFGRARLSGWRAELPSQAERTSREAEQSLGTAAENEQRSLAAVWSEARETASDCSSILPRRRRQRDLENMPRAGGRVPGHRPRAPGRHRLAPAAIPNAALDVPCGLATLKSLGPAILALAKLVLGEELQERRGEGRGGEGRVVLASWSFRALFPSLLCLEKRGPQLRSSGRAQKGSRAPVPAPETPLFAGF